MCCAFVVLLSDNNKGPENVHNLSSERMGSIFIIQTSYESSLTKKRIWRVVLCKDKKGLKIPEILSKTSLRKYQTSVHWLGCFIIKPQGPANKGPKRAKVQQIAQDVT